MRKLEVRILLSINLTDLKGIEGSAPTKDMTEKDLP